MYIYKVHIKNFRNIKDLTFFPNKKSNIIVGPNGAGKTNIADALNFLLDPSINWYYDNIYQIDFNNRNLENEILIKVWIKDLEELIVDDIELLFEHIDEDGNITTEGNGELALITQLECNKNLEVNHYILSNGEKHYFKKKYKEKLKFRFIKGNRDPSKELSLNKYSLLNSMIKSDEFNQKINGLKKEIMDKSQDYIENQNIIDNLKSIEKPLEQLRIIEKNLNSLNFEFLNFDERNTLDALQISLKKINDDNFLPLDSHSKGILNVILLLALKEYTKLHNILVLEEPEQNLEKYLQKKVIKFIKSELDGQMFFITHSHEIIKMFDMNNIFLVRNGNVNQIKSLKKFMKDESIKFPKLVEKFNKNELLSSFYSKGIMLVEGETEKGFIPEFSKEINFGLEDNSIELFWCNGRSNIYKYFKYFQNIIENIFILYDNDDDINKEIEKYDDQDRGPFIFLLPNDYESTIINNESFINNWDELFDDLFEYSNCKDKYLNFFDKNDNGNKDEYKNLSTINEFKEKLSSNDLDKEFTKYFIKSNFKDIVHSSILARFIIKKPEIRLVKEFLNLFKMIDFLNNDYDCQFSDNKCFLEDGDCNDCGFFNTDYNINIIEIKNDN